MTYKISLRIKMYIKYCFIKNILRQYDKIIKDCSICIITTPQGPQGPQGHKIRYLEIYLNDMVDVENFFNICKDLNMIKYLPHYNIKMRDLNNNEIMYSLKPDRNDEEKKEGRLKRKYSKLYI